LDKFIKNKMAILAEALSVIIKDKSIESKYIGGGGSFINSIPNATHCTDGEIHRISFMDPQDLEDYMRSLEQNGLIYLINEQSIDFTIVDMVKGPTKNCNWLGFSRKKFFSGQTELKKCEEDFSIVWLLPIIGIHGIPTDKNGKLEIITPPYWTPDKALYGYTIVAPDEKDKRLVELGTENGVTKYLDTETGKIGYVGRPEIKSKDSLDRN
jgi:hypothetical protein